MGRIRALAAGFALLCLCALPGCEFKLVNLQLPGYFSAGVNQVWFWRLDERGGGYVRSGHLEFEGLSGPAGYTSLEYTVVYPDGTRGLTMRSPVSVSGDSIIVSVNFMVAKSGWFRVSARNQAGESPLSRREVYL